MADSYIGVHNGQCTTFVGPDAVNYFRAEVLASALKLYYNSNGRIIATRGLTMTKMLKMATGYTGQYYKRSIGECLRASIDVKRWADEMKAALPIQE